MAREDLLSQLMIQLTQKEGPPPADDNTLIQKMIAPNETMTASDQGVTLTASDPTKFVWGGNNAQGQYISPGWKWSQGEYKRTYRDVILFDKPVAYYRLDETTGMTVANDSSGNGNTGTIHGGVTLQQPGVLASDAAMDFDGASGYITLSGTFVTTADFAIEMWIKTTSTQHNATSTNEVAVGNGGVWLGVGGSNDNPGKAIWNSGGAELPSAQLVNDGVFHHVVGVRSGSNQLLYIDGALSNNGTITSTVSGTFHIASFTGGDYLFPGTIDEVAIYNYALSARQVQNHYNARAYN